MPGKIESTLEIIRKPSIFRDDRKKVEIGGVRVTISQGTIYVPRGGSRWFLGCKIDF